MLKSVTVARAQGPSLWLPLLLGFLAACLAGVMGWSLGRGFGVGENTIGEDGSPAILTEFRLPSLDGRQLGPVDFGGDVVLVEFWATWCSPCQIQARILEPLWEHYRDRGVQFLAVNVGERRETVEEYTTENPFPYPVLYDSSDLVASQAEIYALPTVMIIDRSGRVSYLRQGLSDATTLRRAVEGARS